jgi:hypothetical protein
MLEALARSGQTVREFARRHAVQEQRVRAWTKRFPKMMTSTPAFLPVRVRSESRAAELVPAGLEVRVRGGRSVRVEVGFDAELLRRVVAALEEGAPC